jgi:hypothetical protein
MPMNLVQLRFCLSRLGHWMKEQVVTEVPAEWRSANLIVGRPRVHQKNGLPVNVESRGLPENSCLSSGRITPI